jgi:hypothetical protein
MDLSDGTKYRSYCVFSICDVTDLNGLDVTLVCIKSHASCFGASYTADDACACIVTYQFLCSLLSTELT